MRYPVFILLIGQNCPQNKWRNFGWIFFQLKLVEARLFLPAILGAFGIVSPKR